MKKTLTMLGIAAVTVAGVQAQVLYSTSGATYSQNFNTLTSTNSTGQAWSNNTTLAGWFLFRQPAPGTALTTYGGDNGGSNAGSFFSYGTTGSSDRALGGLGSGGTYFGSPANGAVAGWMAVGITNTTGSALTEFTIEFDGEQWRDATTTAQTMVLQYGIGSSFTSVSSWTTPGGTFDFTSPVNLNTGGAINGNTVGLVADLGGTASVSWAAGDTLWIRWVEVNNTGNDQGLSVDNLTFTAVPEPTSVALLVGGTLAMALRRRRHLS